MSVKEKCVGLRVWALGLLVLCGALSALCYWNGSKAEPLASDPSGERDSRSADKTCGPACGHTHEADQLAAAKQVTLISSAEMRATQAGDELALSLGEDLKLRGVVSVTKEFAEGRKAITMNLLGREGSVYWLEDTQGGVMGDVVLTNADGNQVYKFTGRDDQWFLQEIPFQRYICASGVTNESVGMPVSDAPFTPAGSSAIIPLLNSRSSAEAVIYIDFDGEVVSGTRWVNGGTINAEESGHTEEEIRSIWEEVAEDMRPFDINVTTDRDVFDDAPQNRKMHVIVTPTVDAAPSAGGVAYLNSFYDGSVDPCWCFNLGLGAAGMTISHEVGHTFGLRHDGYGSEEYHSGNGTWGPIMGAPFGLSVVAWSIGDYTKSTNTEDDLAMISSLSTNGFGYREDDYGDSNADGYTLGEDAAGDSVNVTGVISTTEDVDVFSFQTSGGATTLSALNTTAFINMNIQATLYDDAGNIVLQSEEPGYDATITGTLDPGTYHFHVEGVADGSPDASGFNDYGSLGEYGLTGDVAGLGGLIVDVVDPVPDAVSILSGNGLVLRASVVGSNYTSTWSQVSGPSGGVVSFDAADALTTRAQFSEPGLYTVRITGDTEGLLSSDDVQVSVEEASDAQIFPNRGPAITISSPDEFYSKTGVLSGRAIDDNVPVESSPVTEWLVVSGTAVIANPTASIPTITFADSEPNVVTLESSDGEIRTFKRIDARSVFEARQVIASGSAARWWVPRDDTLGVTWVAPAFDDAAWATAAMALGFNKNSDYVNWIGPGGDLKSVMKKKSPSAFVRIPFSLPTMDYLSGLTLKMKYNDGFVAYINGVEVARRNAPLGLLSWNSTALIKRSFADVVIADEIDLSEGVALASLVAGENVLAIHGLNHTKGSSEFLIDPVLEAGVIASPYLVFTEQHGLGLLPEGDEDGDGLANFVEHALRTDPNAINAETPLVTQTDGSIQITLPLEVPQDIDFVIEQSSDGMTSWTDVASKSGAQTWQGSGLSVAVDAITEDKITYRLRTLEALPNAHFRLRYSLRGPEAQISE